VFAGHYSEGGADFAAAIKKAYADADLSGKRKQWIWSPRTSKAEESRDDASDWRKLLGSLAALVAKFGLWIAIGIALVAILVNHRRWLPWIVERLPHTPAPAAVEVHALAVSDERLPDDIAAAVHALWLQGRPRAALALLYRASLARLTDLIGAPLPPGATESDCLRAARKLRDHPYAALFARIVRCWQAAAYAQRLPLVAEVDALLADWNATREAAA
jgi:hypothetical protein